MRFAYLYHHHPALRPTLSSFPFHYLLFFPVVPPTYIILSVFFPFSATFFHFSFLCSTIPLSSPLHHFLLFSPASFPSFLPLPPFITHHSGALGDRREEYCKLLPLCHSIYYIFYSLSLSFIAQNCITIATFPGCMYVYMSVQPCVCV